MNLDKEANQLNKSDKNPIPQGKYLPAVRCGNIIFTAGMTPRYNGVLTCKGKIKISDDLFVYKPAVKQAAKNALIAAKNLLVENESITKIISMTVYINTEENFTKHSMLADYASEFLFEELGENGIGSRTAVGVMSLPGDAPVEIQMIVCV